jgi:hypothetical protein
MMHHRVLATAVAAVLSGAVMSGAALAQNVPPANHDAGTPAVATPSANNPAAPVAGANSFTREQARSRIKHAGYSMVGGLVKDKSGVWRGTAVKGGTTYHVALDYQGNVVAQ